MRIDLIFGFLGSGKTTLARRILEEWGARERLALIVNEFGDVGVDGAILEGNNIDIVELSSGCLCCTLKGSLLNAIEEMRSKSPLDHIVIEATGVAEPGEMLHTFADPSFKERFELGPITTVVNASKFAKIRSVLGEFFEAQIGKADFLILNKTDLGDAATLEETRREIRAINPDAIIRFAEHCDVDIAEIMQGGVSQAARRFSELSHARKEHVHDEHHLHNDDHRHAPADSFVLDASTPISKVSLENFLHHAPETLWRAKGFLIIDGLPSLVQFSLGDLEVTPVEPREKYYFVLIGDRIERDELERQFISYLGEGQVA